MANPGPTFAITDKKLYTAVVALSTQDNIKLLQQLWSDFNRTINWNKYQSKIKEHSGKRRDFFIDPSLQEVNRLFVISFENRNVWQSDKRCLISTVEVKDYNIKIDGRNFFDQPVKNDLKTYDKVQKLRTGQGDDYLTGCLLDYPYFKKYCGRKLSNAIKCNNKQD